MIGIDFDKNKLEIAKSYGATIINPNEEDVIRKINNETNMIGADGVIITAATNSNKVHIHIHTLFCKFSHFKSITC